MTTSLVRRLLQRATAAAPPAAPQRRSLSSASASTKELFDSYVMPTYGRYDMALTHGKGCYVWDDNGRKLLDVSASRASLCGG